MAGDYAVCLRDVGICSWQYRGSVVMYSGPAAIHQSWHVAGLRRNVQSVYAASGGLNGRAVSRQARTRPLLNVVRRITHFSRRQLLLLGH
jgi:hypothetical protein